MTYQVKTGTNKTTGERVAYVKISYDAVAVDAIKAIDGRRWDKASGCWIVPIAAKEALAAIVAAASNRKARVAPVKPASSKSYWTGTSFGQEDADEIALNGARRGR